MSIIIGKRDINRIKDMVHHNSHTEAWTLAAKIVGHQPSIDVFEECAKDRTAKGYIDDGCYHKFERQRRLFKEYLANTDYEAYKILMGAL